MSNRPPPFSSTQMESTDPPSPNPNVQVAIVSPTSASEKCNSHSFTEESKEEEETHSEEVKETVERDLVAILPERLSAPTSDSPAAGLFLYVNSEDRSLMYPMYPNARAWPSACISFVDTGFEGARSSMKFAHFNLPSCKRGSEGWSSEVLEATGEKWDYNLRLFPGALTQTQRNVMAGHGVCVVCDNHLASEEPYALFVRVIADLYPARFSVRFIITATQRFQEHKCEDMVAKAKQRFRRMVNVLKWTAKIFYIACPSVPKVVIRKAVFHPPKRYHYYYLIGEEVRSVIDHTFCDLKYTTSAVHKECGKRKRIRSAKEAKHSRDVVYFIPQLLLPSFENSDVFDQLERIKVQSREFPANIALLSCVREAEKWCFQFSKFQRHFTADFKAESPLAIWNNFQSKIPLRCGCALLQVDIADFLRCDMMAFDYSGFGVSTGHSNEETIYENIDAVYR
ncbi:unnamed protein product [Toxocara canis]|uniref:DUF2263 domain-containing protein n=1 Tax=Toxocara canis TaxID=6265 RepID=A0A183VBV7_TOXCA|nr:unnamed protein product [Toxocara canis]